MTTFIKKKFKISDDYTNMDKNRLAANVNKEIGLLWFRESF